MIAPWRWRLCSRRQGERPRHSILRDEDVFTNKFTVVRPLHRVNVDLTEGMRRELDARAARLNISRQAAIKTLIDRALAEERPGKRSRAG